VFGFAPIARLVDWWTTDVVYRELFRDRPSSIGAKAVDLAREEIRNGAREWGGNNAGPDVEKYRDGNGGSGPWCASFQYWLEKTARAARGLSMPFAYTPGARKLYRLFVQHGMRVELRDIQVGDLVLWGRGPKGGWQGHVGRVSQVARGPKGELSRWRYIAGNEGRYPAPVAETEGHRRRLVGVARLP